MYTHLLYKSGQGVYIARTCYHADDKYTDLSPMHFLTGLKIICYSLECCDIVSPVTKQTIYNVWKKFKTKQNKITFAAFLFTYFFVFPISTGTGRQTRTIDFATFMCFLCISY